jgi:hypothetical protein
MWEKSCWNERDFQVLTNSTAAAGSKLDPAFKLGSAAFSGDQVSLPFSAADGQ